MAHLSRRLWICGAAASGIGAALAANQEDVHRFHTADFDIELTIEYHDGYRSDGFWFRQDESRHYCLSAGGETDQNCMANFHGSLAVARYRVRPRSRRHRAAMLREYVRTVDRDARLNMRPPFERTIELKQGIGSDLQAFGYELSPGEKLEPAVHSPWYLFRQDLFLEPQPRPFLAIFWKHALPAIRVLDLIPGEQTWPAVK
ncbi:MAG TPA: hypothetical protein VG672_08845 [Bryobacteraceae bacterium]|jgi:hypothetical protein|nr:hypothetical protein [Bryobacteraceae bacterium]